MVDKRQSTGAFRVGFDIGGTFTDLVVANRSGSIRTGKVLTTPDEIMAGVLQGFKELLAKQDIPASAINEIVVGATTVVTNLIIERKGARTGLIVTKGFADVVEIGRELRYDVYDLTAGFPAPLVPQELRMEVDERVDFQGKVVRPLDAGAVETAIKALADKGATSLAVCLLHSYVNPEHEQFIESVAKRIAPNMHVSLSSDVLPEIREYERTIATVLNAYVRPYIGNYLQRIEEGFSSVFGNASLRLMQSSGGMISREYAERLPLRMLESGPAAGALAAAHLAETCGLNKIVAFDMGGTTAKACLITNGEPEVTTEFETARVHRFKRGSGLPVKLPIIDLIEIGAGGGSIAHIDQTGLLKVGPASAGAKPGPACYGLGGENPTVTDAVLLLGYLDREATLSGAVKMQYDKAHASIETKIAKPLGITALEAAVGIYRIVCEQMAAAAKIHSVEKGRDLREYALVAFGGAGPIHACEVARRLRCKEVLFPPDAGVYSAIGLLLAPNKVDAVRSYYVRLNQINWKEVQAFQAEMQRDIAAALGSAGISPEQIEYRNSADMRYVGQGFEVNASIPQKLDGKSTGAIDAAFKHAYAAKFGRSLDDVEVEIVSWRMEGIAKTAWLDNKAAPAAQATQAKQARKRPVYFLERGDFVDTPVHAASELASGAAYHGPMLIEQPGSTIVIGPDDTFNIDARGIVRVAVAASKSVASVRSKQSRINPIDLEIYWSRLIAVVDEAGAALKRTAFSTVVRESNDFACVLLDQDGELLAMSSISVPGFIGTAALSLSKMLAVFPSADLSPGDVLFSNDPWVGSGHLPDATMAAPIFRNGAIAGYVVTVAHLSDIGGHQWSAGCNEVYEEGIRFPIIKIMEKKQVNRLVLDILRANVRVPDRVLGDIDAMFAAMHVCDLRLTEFMDDYGLAEIRDVSAAIYRVSEQAALQEIKTIPPGVYHGEVESDGWDETIVVKARVTVSAKGIAVDYTGSSPQSEYGINESYNHTYAYTLCPFKCMLSPDIPNNDGFTRLFTVNAPEGTIVNSRFPAAVGARQLVGHLLQAAVFDALAEVLPHRAQADSGTPLWTLVLHGTDAGKPPFSTILFYNGGMGATQYRDGYACTSFPANISNTPMEVTENIAPILFRSKTIYAGSGGAGKHTGGAGQIVSFESRWPGLIKASLLTERTRVPAKGLLGGKAGKLGFVSKNGTPVVQTKGIVELNHGDVLEFALPGGGGYGIP